MNILVSTSINIKNGLAPSARMLAYCKGLQQNGCYVEIVNPYMRTDIEGKIRQEKGVMRGVPYTFTYKGTRQSNKWVRKICTAIFFRRAVIYYFFIKYIVGFHRSKTIDVILIADENAKTIYLLQSISRMITKSKVIFVFDEYPIPIRHFLKEKIPVWKRVKLFLMLQGMHGYISISDELVRYYNKMVKRPSFVMSLIVDNERFESSSLPPAAKSTTKYLCYMGNFELSKDDVHLIIRAFMLARAKCKDIELHLYGAPSEKDYNATLSLISELSAEDYVHYMGKASPQEVPNILKNSLILVSAQPDTKRAAGGFPTKLGEYLSSGVPTIMSDVGENSKYVKNREHAFFVKPSDVEEYKNCIEYIYEHYDEALRIAESGKALIDEEYSLKKVTGDLKDFISQLII